MMFFKLGFKNVFFTAVFLIFAGAIYTLQQASRNSSLPIAPNGLSQHIQTYYSRFTHSVAQTTSQFLSLLELKKSYEKLEQENKQLMTSLQIQKQIEDENLRLKKLLNYKEQTPNYQFIVAKITAKDLFTDHYSLFVNKGAKDGVEKLSGVVSPEGVVGYIIDVQENSARLLLVNDRLSSVDAIIQRTRARGIVTGYSNKECQLKYIDRPQEIAEGDQVVTASDQTIFPAGFPVGIIHHIKINPTGVGHLALLKPIVDFKKLEEVMIIKPVKK
ncbi:MAG: rod shape-determining protein MreC [Bdellovibrionales bacterium]|nr:rod shape-determining protein MreC [Bdellovibrionales bacterium]